MFTARKSPIRRTFCRNLLMWGSFGITFVGLGGGFMYSILFNKNWMLGFLILVYFVLQMVFARKNLDHCRRTLMAGEKIGMSAWLKNDYFKQTGAADYFESNPCRVGILLVGYREDPVYWRQCIASIRDYSPPSLVRVVCACIDGNDDPDKEMVEEFQKVWSDCNDTKREDSYETISLESPIETATLLLPHRGKRHTMRSGFEFLRCRYSDLDYIIVMDSDSVITPNSIWSMVRMMNDNPANGCGTGCLEILNSTSFLTKIINARYAYAFNIERSAMSATGTMNCCSGPFSIYRMSCLTDELLDAFIQQRFCLQPVGPGDDRHLTNLILAKGYRSIQCPYSIAFTECPTQLGRFFIQQLRWMRSFYREQPFQMYAIPVQSPYLIIITLYEILFPYVVILSFIPTFSLLYPTPLSVFRNRVLICMGIILVRTFILMVVMSRLDMWYNVFMLPLYFITLLPMKVYALLTVGIQNWMTSNRQFLKNLCNIDVFCMYLVIVLWNILYFVFLSYRMNWIPEVEQAL